MRDITILRPSFFQGFGWINLNENYDADDINDDDQDAHSSTDGNAEDSDE